MLVCDYLWRPTALGYLVTSTALLIPGSHETGRIEKMAAQVCTYCTSATRLIFSLPAKQWHILCLLRESCTYILHGRWNHLICWKEAAKKITERETEKPETFILFFPVPVLLLPLPQTSRSGVVGLRIKGSLSNVTASTYRYIPDP